jgi:hypothetical protein
MLRHKLIISCELEAGNSLDDMSSYLRTDMNLPLRHHVQSPALRAHAAFNPINIVGSVPRGKAAET